jgi:hypothetical protein
MRNSTFKWAMAISWILVFSPFMIIFLSYSTLSTYRVETTSVYYLRIDKSVSQQTCEDFVRLSVFCSHFVINICDCRSTSGQTKTVASWNSSRTNTSQEVFLHFEYNTQTTSVRYWRQSAGWGRARRFVLPYAMRLSGCPFHYHVKWHLYHETVRLSFCVPWKVMYLHHENVR